MAFQSSEINEKQVVSERVRRGYIKRIIRNFNYIQGTKEGSFECICVEEGVRSFIGLRWLDSVASCTNRMFDTKNPE